MEIKTAKILYNGPENATTWSGQQAERELDCIQIGRLHIYVLKNLRRVEWQYDQPDFYDVLRKSSYEVNESSHHQEIDESTFSELQFTHYETENGELFMFKDYAVLLDTWEGTISTHYEKDFSTDDAVIKWDLEDIDEIAEYDIPKDDFGLLAAKIEKFRFTFWENHYQAPGEQLGSEERLGEIKSTYESLADGNNPEEIVGNMQEDFDFLLEEYRAGLNNGDSHSYNEQQLKLLEAQIAERKQLTTEVENLLGTIGHIDPVFGGL